MPASRGNARICCVNTSDKKSALQTLRDKGHRLTPQRMIVLEAIESSEDHVSAEQIYARARSKYPYMNISTVYRTLELLKQLGLVAESDLGGGRFLYHPTGKASHHHLVCRKCGKIEDVDAAVFEHLRDELKARYGFDARFEHMAVFGACESCQRHRR
ncbi:MAG: Fur family transcriptional regulator [Dehalococcoidia bacterium]|nr:Fur family transcriptional regulator [Dehalococcoidia bacterium]